uniref:ATP synthase complex subunit 8 n=1 Tax=Eumeta variegata TaxID=1368026 RepID=A0A410SP44_9NEOP|nr:ATP synthase F0 subunit 8 [Eumeta variegata]QAT97926.1 ATP synthase F0 subunit 8 [Eumeta variegata]
MPQMMPINWTFMFMYFIIILMIFSMINYFNYPHISNNINNSWDNSFKKKYKNMIWKW